MMSDGKIGQDSTIQIVKLHIKKHDSHPWIDPPSSTHTAGKQVELLCYCACSAHLEMILKHSANLKHSILTRQSCKSVFYSYFNFCK